MEYTDDLRDTNTQFLSMIQDDAILSKAALAILCGIALFFLFFALYKRIRRHWSSFYFIMLCVTVIFWAGCTLLAMLSESAETAAMLNTLRTCGIIPLPALLCLHVRQQISYKEENPVVIVLFFLISSFLIFILCRSLFFPQLFAALPALADTEIYYYAFYVYAIITLIRSYLLCFNVFYQMPRRTRRSTRLMLIGITSVAILFSGAALLSGQILDAVRDSVLFEILVPLCAPILLVILLYALYSALHVMPASDVIVTSREFVMGGLDTTVLVMNLKKQILDWNRSDWGTGFPLPKPLYKEPFDIYRKRILDMPYCRVSPHSDDIFIVRFNDKEIHLLQRVHRAGTSKKIFGFVVEITEVTKVYNLLRFFEEIAYIDTLTGLHNRNAYFDYVNKVTVEEKMPLLIFVGDVNYLKRLNDNHGHLFGDELLKTVASVVIKAMPEEAFVARTGGDEFVMLVPGGSEDMAKQFMKSVIAQSEAIHHEVFGSPSISWGYAIMTSADQQYNDVFKIADAMMYEYKKMRNQTSFSALLPVSQETTE